MALVKKISSATIRERKSTGEKIAAVTAYDVAFARLADRAGMDIVLVGDSLGMVVLGYESTLPVTLEEMLHHTRAVRRGTRRALLVADMPYGSYHVEPKEAVRHAIRFVKEAGTEAIKIEGGERRMDLIARLVDAEIPVMGHIGLTPQSINTLGSFRAQGREEGSWEPIENDAIAIAQAGAFSVVIEAVAEPLARKITETIAIPTIGIGASAACDGQVLVLEDMLGLSPRTPKFVRRYGDLGPAIEAAVEGYARDVRSRAFPGPEHVYGMKVKD